jgi:hypothetical protein
MVSNAALQIAQELKSESEEMERASNDLHKKTEEVNQKAGQSIGSIQGTVNELTMSFKQSLTTLSASVRDALKSTRTVAESRYQNLSQRLGELLGQTESNFNTLQNESIATLESLNQHATKVREELETTLTEECEVRKQNEWQIVQRYDSFKALIANEMQIQTAQMEEMSEEAKTKVVKQCNDTILPLKTEIANIRERTRGVDLLPQKVNVVERAIGGLSSQLTESVSLLTQQSQRIVTRVEKLRSESEQVIDHMGERVRILEEGMDKPELATRAEVSETFARLNADFDGRMQEIEQQIGLIFSNLSDLTMTVPVTNRQPAAAFLNELAGPVST